MGIELPYAADHPYRNDRDCEVDTWACLSFTECGDSDGQAPIRIRLTSRTSVLLDWSRRGGRLRSCSRLHCCRLMCPEFVRQLKTFAAAVAQVQAVPLRQLLPILLVVSRPTCAADSKP